MSTNAATLPHPGSLATALVGTAPVHRGSRRKWIILAVGLVAVLGVTGLVVYLVGRPQAATFRTALIARADVIQRVSATGSLQPVLTSPVGAQVSGIVWKLHADYNSEVRAGDLLVELDPALFLNAVALATAQLAQSRANLTSAQATALGAQIARDRTRSLEQQKLVANSDLTASEAIFGQTAGVTRATGAQIAQAQAQLDRAKLDLAHSIVRAPVDGTVISRNIDVGQAVAATLTAPTLFTIAQDLHRMQVHAAVDEADIGMVVKGQSATFTVDAFRDETFPATVREVRNAPQTAQSVVTYDTVLDVENPDRKLRPGMTANVLILVVEKKQVVVVPNEALRFRPPAAPVAAGTPRVAAGTAVYVPDGAGFTRVPVKAGVSDGNVTEVTGLEPGREVIIDLARGKSRPPTAGASGRGL